LIDFCRCRPEAKNAEVLLQKVKGLELVKIENECCGFGGMFSIKYEPVSVSMAEQLVDKAIALGADIIVGAEANCLMHINAYIQSSKKPIKTMHLVDLLSEGWV
jgi:L-lactate dehydrogenase complex protein LldE